MTLRDHRPHIYLAAPLFSEAEVKFNAELASQLETWCDVFLPQRDGGLFSELLKDGIDPSLAKRRIFEVDMGAIRKCTIFVMVLDGRTIDEGAAFELGLAFSLDKICIGLQTDPRRILPAGNNPMIECALGEIFGTITELVDGVKKLAQIS